VRLALVLAPNQRCVASEFFVAMDAGIKRVAAFEFNSHHIALGMIVRTLSRVVNARTVDYHLLELDQSSSLATEAGHLASETLSPKTEFELTMKFSLATCPEPAK
jgi:hypothetical protein